VGPSEINEICPYVEEKGGEKEMKAGQRRTLRGTIAASSVDNRIILNDGRFDTGFKLISFQVAPSGVSPSNNGDYSGILYTEEGAVTANNWDWADNRQIGWALFLQAGTDTVFNVYSNVDDETIVVEDLYLAGYSNKTNLSYEIVLEKVSMNEWEGALGMVRMKSQG
jgi:hypothetical protein